MIQSSRTFRIFVSSTFSDLKAERNALQREVFPQLRKLCEEHGCRFQAIDLRWGVSEEAALDQQAMRICLEEVERCQRLSPRPNFIVLLGDRYGWQPAPYEIPAAEFEEIGKASSPDEQELFATWYRRDDNAVPPVYDLQPRTGQYEDFAAWGPVERRILTVLRRALSSMNLPPDALVKYQASATEQEIVRGALDAEGSEEHVVCFFRNFETLPEEREAAEYIDLDEKGGMDSEAHAKIQKLKEGLRKRLPGNVHEYRATWDKETSVEHLKQFCDDAYAELSGIVLKEIEGLQKIDALDAEINEHKTFGQERARNFTGRKEALDAIAAYINGDSKQHLAIHGTSGSGKSALMAYTAQNVAKVHPDAELILRHIGATPSSSNVHSLIESLCKQIGRTYGLDETAIPTEFKELVEEFSKRLTLATSEKPLIIFIDALDQLSDVNNAKSMLWLPIELPEHVRIIVSAITDDLSHKSLARRIDKDSLMHLPAMNDAEGEALLDLWMAEQGRMFQAEQKKEVLDKFHQNGLPLYLKLAFEMARGWKSYDEPKALNPDIHGIINEMFSSMSDDANHGQVMVSRSLGYLAAAKNGLTENELLDLLSADSEVMEDFKRRSPKSPQDVDRLPVVIWSRLYLDLRPYLTERNADNASLLSFFHRQFREVVTEKYLAGGDKIQRHTAIANYFALQPYELVKTNRLPNYRKVSEIAYQMVHGKMWTELEKTITDFDYPMTKCKAEMVDELVEDYQKANNLPVLDKQSMRIWAAFFRERAHILRRGNSEWPAYKILLQLAMEHADNSPVTRQGMVWEKNQRRLWPRIITGNRVEHLLVSSCLRVLVPKSHKAQRVPILSLALLADGHLALGLFDGTVRLWDSSSGYETASIQAHQYEVGALAILPNGFLITESRRQLASWTMHNFVEIARVDARDPANVITVLGDNRIVSASSISGGGPIKVWDVTAKGPIATIVINCSHNINKLAVLPDGRLVAALRDGTVRLWSLDSGSEVTCLKGNPDRYYRDGVRALAVLWDGQLAYDGGYSVFSNMSTIQLWDPITKSESSSILVNGGKITAFAALTGKRLAVALDDYTVCLIDIQSKRKITHFSGHTDTITALVELPDNRLASASYDGTVRVWDLQKYAVTTAAAVPSETTNRAGRVNAIAVIPDGRVIVGSSDGAFQLRDPESRKILLEGMGDHISSIAVLSEGRLASGSEHARHPGRIYIWNYSKPDRDGKWWLPSGVLGLDREATSVVEMPDGRLISGCYDGSLNLWNISAMSENKRMKGEGSSVKCLSVLTDGRIVSGHFNGAIQVWDIEAACVSITLRKHEASVNAMVVMPDGSLASASSDGFVRIWDVNSGKEIHSFKGNAGSVLGLGLCAKGLLLCGSAGILSIVNQSSGAEIAN